MKNAEYFSNLAKENANTELQNKVKESIEIGTEKYFNFILEEIEKRASKGYGACEINLDQMAQVYAVDEPDQNLYNYKEIEKRLRDLNFKLERVASPCIFSAPGIKKYMIVWNPEFPLNVDDIPCNVSN